jgi:hypothetical protein
MMSRSSLKLIDWGDESMLTSSWLEVPSKGPQSTLKDTLRLDLFEGDFSEAPSLAVEGFGRQG